MYSHSKNSIIVFDTYNEFSFEDKGGLLIKDLYAEAQLFLNELLNNLKIDVSKFELDHICYRVDSLSEYEEYKIRFLKLGELLIESEVGGRLISTFKLMKPIKFKDRDIYLIELPAPKIGKSFKSGFEHAEFVIDISFDEFQEKYQNLNFNTSSIHKAHNPELKVKLDNGTQVKFHHKSLEDVILEEKKGR